MASAPIKNREDEHPVKYIVSACLAGHRCSFDGRDRLNIIIKDMVDNGIAVAVCPETLGGSPVPRERCEICRGDGRGVHDLTATVMTESGRDISDIMRLGAQRALEIAQRFGARRAILKSKSPSCGHGKIYDGTFSGRLIDGDGVTAALLLMHNISVFNEKDAPYAEK